jgi:hypothetical protein
MALQLDKLNTSVKAALLEFTTGSGACPDDFQNRLDDLVLLMQEIQNSMLLDTEQEILDALKQNNDDLVKLNQDIDDYIKKIGAVSEKVQKISGVADMVASVLGTVLSVV